MAEFVMPSLGADMESGTLYEWFVNPGDTVKRGDLMASVETDKGVIDIEVFEDGVVSELLIEPGTRVNVGAVIAIVNSDKAAKVSTAVLTPKAEAHPMDQQAARRPLLDIPPPAKKSKRIKASPLAKRLAMELKIDLGTITPLGADGVINKADVERAAFERDKAVKEAAVEQTAVRITPVAKRMATDLGVDLSTVEGRGVRGAIQRADIERELAPKAKLGLADKKVAQAQFQTRMRRAIAAAMSRANTDIPHYYLETRIDMSNTLSWLEAENQKRSIKERILPVVLLIKATALALAEVPELNGFWLDGEHRPQEGIHIGFAIALRQGGLVTPAIHNADLKTLDELMEAVRDLITRTRSGRLRSSELTDATVTLTSLGDRGVEKLFGVIYPPQVALVGFGKTSDQPWAESGMLGIRPTIVATLSADHRATDGLRGSQFLATVEKYLKEPEKL